MDTNQIKENIIETIKKYVKDLSLLETITDETHLIKDLKINSARLVDIVIRFEDVFDIEIDDDDVDRIRTIGDITAVVQKKMITEGVAD